MCQQCGHEIATHKYSFSVDENFQVHMYVCTHNTLLFDVERKFFYTKLMLVSTI